MPLSAGAAVLHISFKTFSVILTYRQISSQNRSTLNEWIFLFNIMNKMTALRHMKLQDPALLMCCNVPSDRQT